MQLGPIFTEFPTSLAAMDQQNEYAQRFLSYNGFDVMAQSQFSDIKHGTPHAVEGVENLFTTDHTALDHMMYSSYIDFSY